MSRRDPRPVSGICAALLTPRSAASTEADAARLLDYMSTLERAGIQGFVLFGSTGEFVHFDLAERVRVAALALRRSRVPMLVNVSHSDLAGVAALADNAIGMGADGILVMPPYFYRYDAGTIEAFYRSIVEQYANQTAIYLYNLPQHTNPIPPDVAVHLIQSAGVAGIKDSSGDISLLDALSELRREKPFTLLAGNERIYRRARVQGADGAVSGVAAALPELMLGLDRAILAKDEKHSPALEACLFEYLDWLERFPATVLIRHTAALRGWIDDCPAVPLSEQQNRDMARFRSWFPSWLSAVFSELGLS